MGLFNIGKKNEKPYRVMHYEGIDTVGLNMPCTFFIKENVLNFRRKQTCREMLQNLHIH